MRSLDIAFTMQDKWPPFHLRFCLRITSYRVVSFDTLLIKFGFVSFVPKNINAKTKATKSQCRSISFKSRQERKQTNFVIDKTITNVLFLLLLLLFSNSQFKIESITSSKCQTQVFSHSFFSAQKRQMDLSEKNNSSRQQQQYEKTVYMYVCRQGANG